MVANAGFVFGLDSVAIPFVKLHRHFISVAVQCGIDFCWILLIYYYCTYETKWNRRGSG